MSGKIYGEITNLVKNRIFYIVDRPCDKNVVGCLTVLTNKLDQSGELVKRKARVVAHGFTQIPGMDFHETFAPVARLSSIRLVLALAARLDMKVYQVDIEADYLIAELREEIYMKTPVHLKEMLSILVSKNKNNAQTSEAKKMLRQLEEPNQVCELKRALYGLRQAGRKWNEKMSRTLAEMGFKATSKDPCVYSMYVSNVLVMLLLHVDDMLIMSSDLNLIEETKKKLAKRFITMNLLKI